jgi:hypothetical protein
MEAFMEVVKAWIILDRSTVDGSAMGHMEAAEVDGAAEVEGMVVAGGGSGGTVADEERLEANARLSRASMLKVAGPRLRSS